MRANFKKLFNHECDIFARLLYIKIAREKDHAKIYFPQFWDAFKNLLDPIKDQRNRAVFELIEFKGDGLIDIMILMQIFQNLDRDTLFGQEILKLVREYKVKNVLMRSGFRR